MIRYCDGIFSGKGASLLDGYIEGLATDRIYRLMIAQRIRHRDIVKITEDDGTDVEHTLEFISRIFAEELERLIEELPADAAPAAVETLTEARRQSEGMIISGEFNPI